MSTELWCVMCGILFFTVKVFVQHIYWMLSIVLYWLQSVMFWKVALLVRSGKSMNLMLLFAFILANLWLWSWSGDLIHLIHQIQQDFTLTWWLKLKKTSEAVCFVTKTRWWKIFKICVSLLNSTLLWSRLTWIKVMFSLQETVLVQSLDHPAVLPFLISLTADMISVVWYFADPASQYIYLNINQLDALNFITSLFHASTCFEHKCSSSGVQNCTIQSLVSSHLIGVMIPETV